MHEETHRPIQHFVFREGAVAAFVGEDPDSREDEALHDGVCGPGDETEVRGREEGDIGDGEVDEGREVEVIADDVGHGAEDGGLEAVGGNSVVDFFHGIVGELEGIAIEVEMLWWCRSSFFSFFGCHVVKTEPSIKQSNKIETNQIKSIYTKPKKMNEYCYSSSSKK